MLLNPHKFFEPNNQTLHFAKVFYKFSTPNSTIQIAATLQQSVSPANRRASVGVNCRSLANTQKGNIPTDFSK